MIPHDRSADDLPASQDAEHDVDADDYLDYDPLPYELALRAAWAGYRGWLQVYQTDRRRVAKRSRSLR